MTDTDLTKLEPNVNFNKQECKLKLEADLNKQKSESKLHADHEILKFEADFAIDPIWKASDSLLSTTGNESSYTGSSTTPDVHFDVGPNSKVFGQIYEGNKEADNKSSETNLVSAPRINIEAADDDGAGVFANGRDRDRLGVVEKKSRRKNCRKLVASKS